MLTQKMYMLSAIITANSQSCSESPNTASVGLEEPSRRVFDLDLAFLANSIIYNSIFLIEMISMHLALLDLALVGTSARPSVTPLTSF